MLKKKITILVLILAVVTVVSGCGKKEVKPVINDDKQSIKQEQNNEKVEDQAEQKEDIEKIKTTVKENNETILKLIGVDKDGLNVYKSEKYKFEIKFPKNFEFKIFKKNKDGALNWFDFICWEDGYLDKIDETYTVDLYDMNILIRVYQSDLSLSDWYNNFQPLSDKEQFEYSNTFGGENYNLSKTDLVINTEKFENYIKHYREENVVIREGQAKTVVSYYYKSENKIFRLSGITKTKDLQKNINIIDKIIDSFKLK